MRLNSYLRRTGRAALLSAALAAASTLDSSAASLLRFEFDEGSGATVTSESGDLTGTLGIPVDPLNYPVPNPSSPSGAASDQSLTIVDPDGYLLMDATGADALYAVDQPLTVEAWINIPSTAAPRAEGIAGFGGSWKLGFRPDGRLAFTMFGVVDATVDVYPTLLDAWIHVAAVYEPGVGITYYMDGFEMAFFEETRPMRAPVHDWLGIGSGGTGEPINASIDRVRIHQAALTAEQLDSIAAEPKEPLASTLVAFDFDETAAPYTSEGSITRETQFAHDVYVANSRPEFIADSPSEQEGDFALAFDGSDRVIVEDPAQAVRLSSGDLTAQAWVRPGAQAGTKGVFFFNNGLGGAISFAITASRQVMFTTLGIADTLSEAVVPDDGLWHHVAVIHRNGEDLRFFVDGVLADTIPYTGGVLMDVRTDAFFVFGSEAGGGHAYTGGLDRFELLDEAIEPADLDFLAIPGVAPDAPELEIGTAVSIAWPTDATGFILESTTDLNEPRVWTEVGVAPVVIADKYYVLLPTAAEETFYRLVRPTAEE